MSTPQNNCTINNERSFHLSPSNAVDILRLARRLQRDVFYLPPNDTIMSMCDIIISSNSGQRGEGRRRNGCDTPAFRVRQSAPLRGKNARLPSRRIWFWQRGSSAQPKNYSSAAGPSSHTNPTLHGHGFHVASPVVIGRLKPDAAACFIWSAITPHPTPPTNAQRYYRLRQ